MVEGVFKKMQCELLTNSSKQEQILCEHTPDSNYFFLFFYFKMEYKIYSFSQSRSLHGPVKTN